MEPLIKQYGPVSKAVEYLGTSEGKWFAVPVMWGSAPLPPCARISLIQKITGEDVTEWYPAKDVKTKGAAEWTYDKQLAIAEQCHKAAVYLRLVSERPGTRGFPRYPPTAAELCRARWRRSHRSTFPVMRPTDLVLVALLLFRLVENAVRSIHVALGALLRDGCACLLGFSHLGLRDALPDRRC